MKWLGKARYLVVLRNDKVFITEDEVEPTELAPRLAKKGVTWEEIRIILKVPSNEPQWVEGEDVETVYESV